MGKAGKTRKGSAGRDLSSRSRNSHRAWEQMSAKCHINVQRKWKRGKYVYQMWGKNTLNYGTAEAGGSEGKRGTCDSRSNSRKESKEITKSSIKAEPNSRMRRQSRSSRSRESNRKQKRKQGRVRRHWKQEQQEPASSGSSKAWVSVINLGGNYKTVEAGLITEDGTAPSDGRVTPPSTHSAVTLN